MRSLFVIVMNWIKRIISAISKKNKTDTLTPVRPEEETGEIVCYYGCPNSNKAKKLQLNKKSL